MSGKRTSIQIYETTHKELTKLIGELQSHDGKKRSYDEAIIELIQFWIEQNQKKGKSP
jgi:hypothetical protein